jgi:hypothetical protein
MVASSLSSGSYVHHHHHHHRTNGGAAAGAGAAGAGAAGAGAAGAGGATGSIEGNFDRGNGYGVTSNGSRGGRCNGSTTSRSSSSSIMQHGYSYEPVPGTTHQRRR